MMSLHKLTAGNGYEYLTRQVAAHDVDDRGGYASLEAYYSAHGEAPGRWMGRGLAGLNEILDTEADSLLAGLKGGIGPGSVVTEPQMLALFGFGQHPLAEQITTVLKEAGVGGRRIAKTVRLGTPYKIYDGDTEFRQQVKDAYLQHNRSLGVPVNARIPEAVRARIRTRVAERMFLTRFGRPALDDRERAGWMARMTRQQTTAVAGFDFAFSPVKSVSALWAIAPPAVAEQIRAAHQDAVADVVAWLEDAAVFTRLGRDGVRQVNVRGLLATSFEHRDSRAGDPDLHTHVAVASKVQTLAGQWRALDGQAVYAMTVAASERYNTRLETFLGQRLGLRFAARIGSEGKRVIREVVGVPMSLIRHWSTRRAMIDEHREVLAGDFQARHGRPPSPVEAVQLAQQANLETRPAKPGNRSLAEQRAAWNQDAVTVLGDQAAVAAVVRDSLTTPPPGGPRPSGRPASGAQAPDIAGDPVWVETTAQQVLQVLARTRATWGEAHVRAEAERQVRSVANPAWSVQAVSEAVEHLVDRSLRAGVRLDADVDQTSGLSDLAPPLLRRQDGSSVYEHVQAPRWTSPQVLDAERRLLAIAGRGDGVRMDPLQVELTLVEAASRPGAVALNEGQAALVRELTQSGARLQVALAPAGTGKTTAMDVLAQVWTAGGGTVLGLAPSAAAADVLRRQLPGGHTDTIAKLLDLHAGRGVNADADWAQQIGPQTLIVVDESGMASTPDLAALAEIAVATGASIRLIGDDDQLAAVGAGGVLRDITRERGAASLTEVVRFADPIEGAASLALRAGDPAAIGWYLDRGRVHVGDTATAAGHAYAAWSQDLAAGRDAILLAPVHDMVTALNLQAQADRIAHATAQGHRLDPAQVTLLDHTQVSAGDLVLTTQNSRRLRYRDPDSGHDRWVMNGDRWVVEAITQAGDLQVRHRRNGGRLTLPAPYAGENVVLGYASTIHAAQGLSVDTAHVVAGPSQLTRQLLYVAMTRGRLRNDLYLGTAGDGEEHSLIWRDSLLPPTAADLIARILAYDGAQTSASTTLHQLTDPRTRLQAAAARYGDAVHAAVENLLGTDRIEALCAAAEQVVAGVSDDPAWPALVARLARYDLEGLDAIAALASAAQVREMGTAQDRAAVLDWRLSLMVDPHARPATPDLPWLPSIPATADQHPLWGPYLRARAQLAQDLAADVATQPHTWTPDTIPVWARTLTHLRPPSPPASAGGDAGERAGDNAPARGDGLLGDLAVWRACRQIPDTDPDPIGPPPVLGDERRHHQWLRRHLHQLTDQQDAPSTRWAALLPPAEARVAQDPWWPHLVERLEDLQQSGLNTGALIGQALHQQRPLPDEHPASALWWRLQDLLRAPTTGTEPHTGPTAPEPSWLTQLPQLLGADLAEQVGDDPALPALAQAVHDATGQDWAAEQILAVAAEHLHEQHHDHPDDERADQAAGGDPEPRPISHAAAMTGHIQSLLGADTAPHAPVEARHPGDDLRHPHDEPSARDEDLPPDPLDLDTRAPGEHEPTTPAPQLGTDFPTTPPPPAPEVTRAPKRAVAPPQAPAAAGTGPASTGAADSERLYALNAAAADFYAARLSGSWAQASLQERLGLDASGVSDLPGGHRAGYAPPGWNALISHLHRTCAATDEELLAAGLASRARTGSVIDRFRDRLVLPVHTVDDDTGQVRVAGFVARRNPARDREDTDVAGPKYLNTSETAIYTKGDRLFGLAENRDAIRAGAIPVLVEGPMDALAVTAAGQGRYVGIASLGTALTRTQIRALADLLPPRTSTTASPAQAQEALEVLMAWRDLSRREELHPDRIGWDALARPTGLEGPPRHRVLVATDADAAGQAAARKMHDLITGEGVSDLGRVRLPAGGDPASVLHEEGPAALLHRLQAHEDLATHLVQEITTSLSEQERGTVEGRVFAGHAAADIIAAQPMTRWPYLLPGMCDDLDLFAGTIWFQRIRDTHTALTPSLPLSPAPSPPQARVVARPPLPVPVTATPRTGHRV